MENINQGQSNIPQVQQLPQNSITPSTNWSKIILFIFLGLIVITGVVFASIQISKSQTNNQKLIISQPTLSLTQTVVNPTILPTTSNIVTGKVLILTITDKTMTIQFIAESSKGNITKMMVWTDANPTKEWQKFSTLLTLPISDNVYVKYSDNLNNESQIYSDTIFPSNEPPPPQN